MEKFGTARQIFAALAASMIMLCNGFHYEWPALFMRHQHQFGDGDVPMTQSQFSWVVSFLFIGSIFGAFVGLILVDILGRRTTLLLMTGPFVISCVLIAFARFYWLFYLARFIAGIGVGVGFMVTPMYIGEIAEGRIRGGLCVLMAGMMCLGQILAYAIGLWVANAALAIVGGIIPIVFGTALLWAPESPYYYAMKKAPNDTRKSLVWLRGKSDVAQEVEQIHNSMALNRRKPINYLNLFTVCSNRKTIRIIIGLLTCQILSGSSILTFYTVRFFREAELGIKSEVVSFAVPLISLLTSIFIAFPTDKVGRRPLLIVSASLCGIFLLVQALYIQLTIFEIDVTRISWLPMVGSIGYMISYSMGLGILPSVIIGEVFPCEVKAFALAISIVYYFVLTFVVTNLWSFAIFYHYGTIIIFYVLTVFNIASTIFIYLFVPETKQRSLSEIQIGLQGHLKPQF